MKSESKILNIKWIRNGTGKGLQTSFTYNQLNRILTGSLFGNELSGRSTSSMSPEYVAKPKKIPYLHINLCQTIFPDRLLVLNVYLHKHIVIHMTFLYEFIKPEYYQITSKSHSCIRKISFINQTNQLQMKYSLSCKRLSRTLFSGT